MIGNRSGNTAGGNKQPGKPGQSTRPKKLTEYGIQLQEKQKVRRNYGLREAQFRRYFNQSARFRGQTGEILLQKLETRLDNVLYRSGLTKTRAQARQLVNHRHFVVNGKRVGIPSLQIRPNDVIKPYKASTLIEPNSEAVIPGWLKVDNKTFTITIKHLPTLDELPLEFDTQKIIEFYSR